MIAFALVVIPIMVTPGVSVTLVTQRVVRDGPRAGFAVAAGTACGLLVHATAAVVGLAALVAASATAFSTLRLAGAAYLIWLGARAVLSALRGREAQDFSSRPRARRGAFVQAWLGNVLNPRAASVYLTLVPQFIRPGDSVLVVTAALVSVHIVMQTLWLSAWTLAVYRLREALSSGRARRILDSVAGTTLMALGLRTATVARR
jgi:threonine/homoserine/homoserine lactone efflux protein